MTPLDSDTQLYVSGQPPSVTSAAGRRWWEADYGSWRRAAEQDAMGRHFPGFDLRESGDVLYWVGWLRSGLDPERRYRIRLTYPPNFPDVAPEVVIAEPTLPEGVPHVLATQRPCLYQPSKGPRGGYEPGRTTAATLVAWTALWIHAFETWQATGNWPGRAD